MSNAFKCNEYSIAVIFKCKTYHFMSKTMRQSLDLGKNEERNFNKFPCEVQSQWQTKRI